MYWTVLNGISIIYETLEDAREAVEMFFLSYRTIGATASITEYNKVISVFYLDKDFELKEVKVGS